MKYKELSITPFAQFRMVGAGGTMSKIALSGAAAAEAPCKSVGFFRVKLNPRSRSARSQSVVRRREEQKRDDHCTPRRPKVTCNINRGA